MPHVTRLSCDIVRDTSEARRMWDLLSPRMYLYDEWDVRWAFFDPDRCDIRFHVLFDDSEPVGVLPLQFDTSPEYRYLEFFGGDFMEYNRPFMKSGYEHVARNIYASVTERAELEEMVGEDPFTCTLPVDDATYRLDLRPYRNAEHFVEREVRSDSIRYALRRLRSLPVTLRAQRVDDLSVLFEQSVRTFGDDSWFADPHYRRAFERLSVCTVCTMQTYSFLFEDRVVGVVYSVDYRGRSYLLMTSTDRDRIPEVAKLLIFHTIDSAIARGCQWLEAGVGDCGWKERWHLERVDVRRCSLPQRAFTPPSAVHPSQSAHVDDRR
jgi:CelD/BcsL family acetyltransferase involved in cellulose biosynthesis